MSDLTKRRTLQTLLHGSVVLWLPPVYAAGGYPSRPVTLLVPQPAGGGADALCRTLQGRLQEALGQPVIVDNRGGAAGNIGTATGLAAAPDGYTVTFVNLSTMAVNPHLYAKPGYSLADVQPVILLASVANLFAVNVEKVRVKTMKEFIDLARRQPGKFTYATAGNGSGNHLGGEMLKKMSGIDIVHVPYKGGGPALNALLGGEVDSAVIDPLAALPHLQAGRVRALAVTSAKRAAALPDVPTIAESGVPGYAAPSWAGIVVHRSVPAHVVDRLHAAFLQALKAPEVAGRLTQQLYEPVGSSPREFAALIRVESEKYAKLIKQLDMKLE